MPAMVIHTATTTTTGPAIGGQEAVFPAKRSFQATVTGTGTVTADVNIEGSNDGVHWVLLGTIELDDTDVATDGFTTDAPWLYVHADVTDLTGTGAEVVVVMGT